jgi:hypothetical protein
MEKKPSQSKKFIAFFFTVTMLISLGIATLITQVITAWLSTVLLAIVLTVGTIGVGYIIGQAGLDKYAKIAEISTKIKGLVGSDKD